MEFIPEDLRATMADELRSLRSAATALSCGRPGAVFQPTTPSGEFMAKCALPSATLLQGVTYLGAPGASASRSPGLYDPLYSASAGETIFTSRPAAS